MIKTPTRHGNSVALVIEKPIPELVGADAETPFAVTTDGQVLILSPSTNPSLSPASQTGMTPVA